MSEAALAAAARLFASTPMERIRTHRLEGDDFSSRGGRPRVGVQEQRMKFVLENMHMKRRQIAEHLGISPDRVSSYLRAARRINCKPSTCR